MEAFFEFVKLSFLLVKILYQPSSSFLHLVQTSLKTFNDSCHWTLYLSSVLGMPDIVSDELLNGLLPLVLEHVFFTHHLQLVHEAVNVLYENVISSDQHFLLLGLRLGLFLGILGNNLRSLAL